MISSLAPKAQAGAKKWAPSLTEMVRREAEPPWSSEPEALKSRDLMLADVQHCGLPNAGGVKQFTCSDRVKLEG
jgi:hypothetical protein